MLNYTGLEGKNVLVLGLAKSGYEAAKLLTRLGANVVVNDGKDLSQDSHAKDLENIGVKVIGGEHPLSLLDNEPIIFKNPGIPYTVPILQEAQERGLKILTEVELSYLISEAPIIGVTGTNGKTTVTSLIGDIFQKSRLVGRMSGNIGYVASKVAQEVTKDDYLVTELSSFQLLGIEQYKPHIAIITNIYSAHLDYHETLENYQNAKKQIYKNQDEHDYLICNYHQRHLIESESLKAKTLYFSTQQEVDGIYIKDGYIVFKGFRIIHTDDLVLPGEHNLENILAAVLAALLAGVPVNAIIASLTTFSGIEHRLQYIGTNKTNKYYNDSKATNTLATQFALNSFNQPIIWLCGGLDRGNGFDELIPYMENVRVMITFGETQEKFVKLGESQGKYVIKAIDIKDAVNKIQDIIEPNDVVLLSPACASWDQYNTFEERGQQFIDSFKAQLPSF
ncbi:UDP-N-acetylmuramoyl-L-alanine--D-glutamate ligase [Staphylococcus kloosii]|jgi:UDP-N-acetylmuramoylalanine--D-glutamate ligase|uniref:UDP-N-acetylmuramoylalanine--D-glutamate ligase n=2 Tax=Staphylococcus kloosii TaxID=29384 RepID=A0A921H0X1_9STAP|nr:UDP-N-acetylmuramoyl-L-alanine--D-glutamate ligase [Staphylococcus kloosii]AVQ36447.1 UDP-N-acetylmuramoyl-L-alanine--D-glutamate ligase [Staphylococcus kloosii]MCD8878376.1 UDP-N-acetylmuramoyl-L-alanine--D-glutamate ligase [Staphylococcus kloosii]PNZ07774.1 UDP-N-acetylmuramoyl-L-alanine--D-glutamate ligase [Staphylococcus kloosii]PTJ79376.1 UDP-N-acetylmuramoyl-L-alanine--D-glutamate ligase [Staphylococcus kloosii]SUM49534.1 UDP-N-acetylmuramoyl-L-alanyl-D-glutamate synthetase [Staphyloc